MCCCCCCFSCCAIIVAAATSASAAVVAVAAATTAVVAVAYQHISLCLQFTRGQVLVLVSVYACMHVCILHEASVWHGHTECIRRCMENSVTNCQKETHTTHDFHIQNNVRDNCISRLSTYISESILLCHPSSTTHKSMRFLNSIFKLFLHLN